MRQYDEMITSDLLYYTVYQPRFLFCIYLMREFF